MRRSEETRLKSTSEEVSVLNGKASPAGVLF